MRRRGLAVAGTCVLAFAATGARGEPDQNAAGERAGHGAPSRTWHGARHDHERVFARSARGRPLAVTAFGTPRARRRVLIVGCIHGTECAGIPITHRVAYGCPPVHADVWAVPDLNPDGRRLGVRVNGRGVDLNRNFAAGWRAIGRPWDPQHSGPRPFSEPETRAARDLVRRLRPAVTVWYHQGEGPYVRAWGQSIPAARRYARAVGLPFRRMPWPAGTAPHWQNRSFAGTSSFVVELPPGRLSAGSVRRHAAAVELLAGYRGENRAAVGGSSAEGP